MLKTILTLKMVRLYSRKDDCNGVWQKERGIGLNSEYKKKWGFIAKSRMKVKRKHQWSRRILAKQN